MQDIHIKKHTNKEDKRGHIYNRTYKLRNQLSITHLCLNYILNKLNSKKRLYGKNYMVKSLISFFA